MYKTKGLTTLLLLLVIINTIVSAQNQTLIKANYSFNSEKGIFEGPIEILVNRNRIKEVGRNLEYDAKITEIIDLGDATLLPGLIDLHTHLFIEEELHPSYTGFGETVIKNVITKSDATRALEGAARARSYLKEGFTSIRDLGNSGLYVDVDLKNAIKEGWIKGPRMFVSGPGIAATGGQVNGVSFENTNDIVNRDYQIINGTQEAIAAVRDHLLMRVDLIKVYTDNIPNRTTLNIDELKAVVYEARRHQKRITAHAITDQAIWNATKAGVHSIEHAYGISDSTLTIVKEKGITLVPTYSNIELSNELFIKNGVTDSLRRSKIITRSSKQQQQSLQRLYRSGVKLGFGTDFYSKTSFSRGENAKKSIYAFIEAEIPLEKVLQYATINAAETLGLEKQLGRIQKGFLADIIAVKGDLSKNSSALEHCMFVMKNGEVVLNNTKIKTR